MGRVGLRLVRGRLDRRTRHRDGLREHPGVFPTGESVGECRRQRSRGIAVTLGRLLRWSRRDDGQSLGPELMLLLVVALAAWGFLSWLGRLNATAQDLENTAQSAAARCIARRRIRSTPGLQPAAQWERRISPRRAALSPTLR